MTTLFTHGHRRQSGFTLIELLIALAVFGMAVSAIYGVYISQSRTYTVQNQVTAAQQDLRAGIDLVSRELRMAGLNPLGAPGVGFVNGTDSTFVAFTTDQDVNGHTDHTDGTDKEDNVSFEFRNGALYFSIGDGTDSDGDSKIDVLQQGSAANPTARAIIDNVDKVEFAYVLKGSATPTTDSTTINSNLANIQAVDVSILVRTSHQDPNYVNTTTYTTLSGAPWGPFNDGYRRRLLTTVVKCRNM